MRSSPAPARGASPGRARLLRPVPRVRRPVRLPMPARRQQLIDSARHVFASRGFRGATTRELASAAGVTEAVIFQHFADKQALYDAVLLDNVAPATADPWFTALDAARRAGNDAAVLHTLYAGLLDLHEQDPHLMRLVTFAALEGHPIAPRLHARGRRLYRFLEKFIVERQHQGRFRPGPPAVLIRGVLALPIYDILLRQLFKTPWPPVDRDTLIAAGAAFMLAGLSAAAPGKLS